MITVPITEKIAIGPSQPLLLVAGPCQLETLGHSLMLAEKLKAAAEKHGVNFVFKASFDKANRTSLGSPRGPGLEDGLSILAKVRKEMNVPVITDIHLPEQAAQAAEVVDIIQIPAFLCRQTDLLLAAGACGKPVQLKKGQFVAADDMKHSAAKVASRGNQKIILCERGNCYGYRDLVVDMRNLCIMRSIGYPVVFDATHSIQTMGGSQGVSGGRREFILPLARGAAAVGVDGLFVECHEAPDRAPSDGSSMLPLGELDAFLTAVCRIRAAAATLN